MHDFENRSMAKFVDLGSLNKSSARVAVFAVRLCNGQTTDYEYTNKKTQKVTKAHKFEVHMVGQKPESYCIGYVKDSADAVGKARHKFLTVPCGCSPKLSLTLTPKLSTLASQCLSELIF